MSLSYLYEVDSDFLFMALYLPYLIFLHKAMTNFHKWKNHFYEIKGDVGMSLHEKERNKKMPIVLALINVHKECVWYD